MVNSVGNKSRELNITAASEASVLQQATAAMQSESGVNLDEEATNLMRYQQAYQAAGKMMQIASQMFDTLMQLGR
jgi:flagellar hook-associated protein 1 FlgK